MSEKCGLEIGQTLGSGSFGNVTTVKRGNDVYAMKVSRSIEWNEIIAQSSINSTNVLQVQGLVGPSADYPECAPDGIPILYTPGIPMTTYIKNRIFSVDEQVAIAQQLIKGLLDTFHSGILHRDIKEGNILVTKDEKYALLFDYGLARFSKDCLNDEGVNGDFVGTPEYMAPRTIERYYRRGNVCAEDDIFSLGVTLMAICSNEGMVYGDLPTLRRYFDTMWLIFYDIANGQNRIATPITFENATIFNNGLNALSKYSSYDEYINFYNTVSTGRFVDRAAFFYCFLESFLVLDKLRNTSGEMVRFFTGMKTSHPLYNLLVEMTKPYAPLDRGNGPIRCNWKYLQEWLKRTTGYNIPELPYLEYSQKEVKFDHLVLVEAWYKKWCPHASIEHTYNITDRFYRSLVAYERGNWSLNHFYREGGELDTKFFLFLGCLYTEILITSEYLYPTTAVDATIAQVVDEVYGGGNINITSAICDLAGRCVIFVLDGNLYQSSLYITLSSKREIEENLEYLKDPRSYYSRLKSVWKGQQQRRNVLTYE